MGCPVMGSRPQGDNRRRGHMSKWTGGAQSRHPPQPEVPGGMGRPRQRADVSEQCHMQAVGNLSVRRAPWRRCRGQLGQHAPRHLPKFAKLHLDSCTQRQDGDMWLGILKRHCVGCTTMWVHIGEAGVHGSLAQAGVGPWNQDGSNRQLTVTDHAGQAAPRFTSR